MPKSNKSGLSVTQGSWTVRDSNGEITQNPAHFATIYAGEIRIAEVEAPTLDQRQAGINFLLMAAAPDLYAQIKCLALAVTGDTGAGIEAQHLAQHALTFLETLPRSVRQNETTEHGSNQA